MIILGRRSFSTAFYTQGRVLRVDELKEVGTRWPEGGACLAIKRDDPHSKALASAGTRMIEDLGVHHDRQVSWVEPTAAPQ